jgi:hypothetical protein
MSEVSDPKPDHGLDRLRDALLAGTGGRARRHTRPGIDPALTTQEPTFHGSEIEMVRSIYWAVFDLRRARGEDAVAAGRVAVEITRAALLVGPLELKQKEAAQVLGIGARDVRRDLEGLRALGPGVLEDRPGLPPIPRPDDTIRISAVAA